MPKVMSLMTVERMIEPGKAKTANQAAVEPKTQTIQPFTVFECSDEEAKDLALHGAVTEPDERKKFDLSEIDDKQGANNPAKTVTSTSAPGAKVPGKSADDGSRSNPTAAMAKAEEGKSTSPTKKSDDLIG